LSLGHKQLEENPWDVFETLFTLDSIHEGTVMEVFDKGAVIALPYGVEGFVTPKHLVKEDGLMAKVDEKLQFKVIEFNKSAKKIILSHSRVFEDEKKVAEAPVKKSEPAAGKKTARKAKTSSEKTTLGDITQLAALKEEMEEKENKASKK
jgi:small subunit ribosomal protein S1